jgi:hypothetical protein
LLMRPLGRSPEEVDFLEDEEINLPTHHAFKVVLKCDC